MQRSWILWIVVLAALLWLIHLSTPPIGMHAWRQSDTAAIARNYHENGYRFAYPEIDWAGDRSGHVETNCPVYAYVVPNAIACSACTKPGRCSRS